jgi:D-sedoheptulose 7-phosphate isomerase
VSDNLFEAYIRTLGSIENDKIKKIADMLLLCVKKGGRIFTAGNGGSHCIAQHFASDLTKPVGHLRMGNCSAINLGDNLALMSAVANDMGYEQVFSYEANWHNLRYNDAVVIFSVSGTSKNINQLVGYADAVDATVVALVGKQLQERPHPEWGIDDWRYLYINTGQGKKSPEHYYICESVFSCVAHEIARQFHIFRGNYSAEG